MRLNRPMAPGCPPSAGAPATLRRAHRGAHLAAARQRRRPPAPPAAAAAAGGAAPPPRHVANLLVKCRDAKGVVASLAQLLYGFNCNILSSDQFTDDDGGDGGGGMFYQRIELDYSDLFVGAANTGALERGIADVGARYGMEWTISYAERRKRVAVLVSRLDHCLYDLLIRRESGELACDIPVVASNHADLAPVAAKFGVPFVHLPIAADGDRAAARAAQEEKLEALLADAGADVVVLARYMQVLSPGFCERNWARTINIHHSFLPAFEGGRPYHRAHDRGVKVIGATAHYATADLDCGPIIQQDVARVSHRDGVADLVRKGRDLERLVLARALRWHLGDRVIVHGGKTVVFED